MNAADTTSPAQPDRSIARCLARWTELDDDSARRDTEVLLCHVLQCGRAHLIAWPEQALTPAQFEQFGTLMAARREGQPIAYLIGQREFWSLPLAVTPATLIPRPETETLVEWALALDLPTAARVVDLGTGSGAIALALAHERPAWRVQATDSREETLAVARHNAAALDLSRVSFSLGAWYQAVTGDFDLIVSNPPYVARGDSHLQQGDLRFEPASALVAGDNGLADLRVLIEQVPAFLSAGGWLLLEHGCEQGEKVRALLQAIGFAQIETRRDCAGLERITGGCLHAG